jgi:hypothetical protein
MPVSPRLLIDVGDGTYIVPPPAVSNVGPATAATPAPPQTLTAGGGGMYPVASVVTEALAAASRDPAAVRNGAGIGAWTLAAREARVGVIVDVSMPWPEQDDALVPLGVRVPTRQSVTLISAPVAASLVPPPPASVLPQQTQAIPAESAGSPADTDALVPAGVTAPSGYLGVTLIRAPTAAQRTPSPSTPPEDLSTAYPSVRQLEASADLPDPRHRRPGFLAQLAKEVGAAAAAVGREIAPSAPSGKELSRPLAQLIVAAKHPPKLTSQQAARVRKLEQVAAKGNAIANPSFVVRAAAIAHLPIAIALGVLSQESFGGRNVWGYDTGSGSIFAGGVDPRTGKTHGGRPVAYTHTLTEAGYRAYRAEQKQILKTQGLVKKQGVGPTQLTEPFLQNYADLAGGSWKPFPNLIIGFSYLAYLIQKHGVEGGLYRYNGSLGYSNPVLIKARQWVSDLGLKSVRSP